MDSVPSNSPVKIHHFFKIIFPDHILPHSKLMIPKRFVRKYGNMLPSPVFLETPDASWPVDLERRGNQIWLQNGWPEFAKHHSLCYGHFLLFGYQENSNKFSVCICDKTASEIQYPPSNNLISTNNKKAKLKHTGEECSPEMNENTKAYLKTVKGRGRGGRKHAKERCLREVKAFKSGNPFCMVTLCPSSVYESSGLFIPRGFAENFMTENRSNVILQVGGRSWSVRCILYPKTAYFGSGWVVFSRANKLDAGDICVFELIDRKEKLLKVHICEA